LPVNDGVAIIIPAFNEEERIVPTLESLAAVLPGYGNAQVIVVNDGSTDGTAQRVEEFIRTHAGRFRLINLSQNCGKGAAVKHGILSTEDALVGYMDADLPYDLSSMRDAVEGLRSRSADIVIGARDLRESHMAHAPSLLRRIAGKAYSVLIGLFLMRGIPDTQCGLKFFQGEVAREIFRRVTIPGFGFDVEVIYIACKRGYRIQRIPVVLSHSHQSKVQLIRDSIRMFFDLFRIRRNGRRGLYS
jgi:dolichyl-phosphate beta-glucosyltransferase